ncbi:MAG: hypothetical protein IE890_12115, partial [Arcobacter sp.]|nr:hypothetical protein [Arcobacter sp.]
MSKLTSNFAVPLKIVLPYFIVGIASYFLFFAMLSSEIFFSIYNEKIFVSVHMFGVGFLLMFFFGASLQLFPVILNVPHKFEKIFYLVFLFLFIGYLLLIVGFWHFNFLLKIGAFFIITAFIIYLTENFITIQQVKKYTFYTVAIGISHLYLMLGFIIGLLMVFGILSEASVDIAYLLSLHLSFILGYMLIMIGTISITLIPMFALSHNFSQIYTKIAIVLLYIMPLLVIFKQFELLRVDIVAALFLLFIQAFVIYKKRVRKEKDVYFYSIVFAYIGLLISGILIIFSDYESAIFVLLLWFMGFMITGHVYKIIPFLAWFEYYSPLVGKQKVPLLNQMVSKKDSKMQLLFSFLGIITLCIGFY